MRSAATCSAATRHQSHAVRSPPRKLNGCGPSCTRPQRPPASGTQDADHGVGDQPPTFNSAHTLFPQRRRSGPNRS